MDKYDKILYTFSKRFYDLRREESEMVNGKKKTFKQISEEIFKKTGISISHTQLAKYQKMSEDPDEMVALAPNIKSIIALSEYYNVSVEYMLGLSESKEKNMEYKAGNKILGLSDSAMKILHNLNLNKHIFNVPSEKNNIFKKFSGANFVDYVLTNYFTELIFLSNKYLYEVQRLKLLQEKNTKIDDTFNVKKFIETKSKIKDEIKFQEDFIHYRKFQIMQMLVKFIDSLEVEVLSQANEKES